MDLREFIGFICVLMFFGLSQEFEFSPPSITAYPLIINQLSTYQITIDRAYTQDLVETKWNSQAVLLDSNITINFPIQYNIKNNINSSSSLMVESLIIDGVMISSFEYVIQNETSVTIMNFIENDSFINTIVVTFINVLNPSPAITTGTFTVRIGSDYSSLQGNSNSIITLSPQTFINCSVSFQPKTTNTTGDMIILITPKTGIQSNGSLVIDFPVTLQWLDDISTNHQLNLDQVNNCIIQSTQISQVTCSGQKATHSLTILFISNSTISNVITSQFKLIISGLFSPPTINPIDIIKISSFNSFSYGLDTCSTLITGLQPQSFPLIIQPSLNPLYVDVLTTLSFNFTNSDTISRDDYFQIIFPNPTIINYIRTTSNFAFSSVTYNSTTLTLKLIQSFSSINTNINTLNYIKFLNYRSPLTIKQTNDIVITIYNSAGRKKMQAKNKIKAQQRLYNILSQSADLVGINDVSNYYLTFNISNSVSSKAMLKILLPVQLSTMNNISSCPSLLNISYLLNTQCIITLGKKPQQILVKSIFPTIPSGQYKLTIPSLINPTYSLNLTQFKLYLYYNESQEYLVAEYNSIPSNNFTIWPKPLNNAMIDIKISDYQVGAKNLSYTIILEIGNALSNNGFVDLYFPSKGQFVPGNSFTCILNINNLSSSLINCTYDTIKRHVRLNLSDSVPTSTILNLTITDIFTNPLNTRPISFTNIQTLTSNINKVQYLKSPFIINGFLFNRFKSKNITKGSDKNSQINNWTLIFETLQKIDQSQVYIKLQFFQFAPFATLSQVQLTLQSKNSTLSLGYSVSQQNKSLEIILPSQSINETIYSFKLNGVTNPATFYAYNYRLSVVTYDNYLYVQQNFTLKQTFVPSQFSSVSYYFGNRILRQFTNLTITVKSRNDNYQLINEFKIDGLKQYMENNNTLTCQNNTVYSCLLINSNNTLLISLINSTLTPFPNPFTFTVSNLYIRPQLNFTPISLTSYSSGYKASQFMSIEFGAVCDLPCKECKSQILLQSCTSCFVESGNKWLYNETCLSNCPQGYYESVVNVSSYQYQCVACKRQCLTCDLIDSNCTSCNGSSLINKYFYNYSCIQQCPNTTYFILQPNTTSLICTLCISPCSTCLNQTLCTSCIQNYFLYDNKCLILCPENITITNVTSKTCENCSIGCKTCINSTTTCLSCQHVNNVTYYHVAQLFQCVTTCPVDKVLDATQTKCVNCQTPCHTCSILQNNCTSCLVPTYLSSTQPNKCVNTCESFSYPNILQNKCLLCQSVPSLNCKNCSSSTTCSQCDKNTIFVFFSLNSSCLSTVPSGYVNISGVAVKCDTKCKQCYGTAINCTSCHDGLYLLNNTCVTGCPMNMISINSSCFYCQSPCFQCSITQTNCTKCFTLYYFMNNSQLIPLQQNKCMVQCPQGYYHSSYNVSQQNKSCMRCQFPCKTCENSTYCLLCLNQQYAYNGSCYSECPNGTVSNNQGLCLQCSFPCVQCTNKTYQCVSCVEGYYIYQPLQRCFLPQECPQNVSIENVNTKQCQVCMSLCLTCMIQTTLCTSCVEGSYLYDIDSTCINQCPLGYYANSGINKCLLCPQQCTQCVQQNNCSQCATNYFYFNYQCLTQCPSSHSIVINNSCTLCKEYCLNCSSSNFCYECDSSTMLLNGECMSQCPFNMSLYYNTSSGQRQCLTVQQMANTKIQQILTLQPLSFSTIFPLPFTIISSLLFITGSIMSCIQNQHTYIIGWGYVIFGIAQVSSLGYFFFKFYMLKQDYSTLLDQNSQLSYDLMITLLIICLGTIGGLNLISIICGSCYMVEDNQFHKWIKINKQTNIKKISSYLTNKIINKSTNKIMNSNINKIMNSSSNKGINSSSNNKFNKSSNKIMNQSSSYLSSQVQIAEDYQYKPQKVQNLCCQPITVFIITSMLSLVITFKLRLILFTRLFDLYYFKAKFQDIQKFRFFNILTLIGFVYQGIAIYVMYKELYLYEKVLNQTGLLMTTIDCLVMLCLNVLVGVLSMRKNQNFFNLNIQQQSQLQDKNNKLYQDQNNNNQYNPIQSTKRQFKQKQNNNKSFNHKNKLGFSKLSFTNSNKGANIRNNKIANININNDKVVNLQQIQPDSQNNYKLTNRKNKKSVVTGKIINKNYQKQPQLTSTKKHNLYQTQYQTNYQKQLSIKQQGKEQKIYYHHQKNNKSEQNKSSNKSQNNLPTNNKLSQYTNIHSTPIIKNTNKHQSHLLTHNIQSPKSKLSPQNQFFSSNKKTQNQFFSSTQKTQNWSPKIKQTHIKPSLLSQIDMIQLYNPKFQQFNQQLKSSRSQKQLKTQQLKTPPNSKNLKNHPESPLKIQLSKISQIIEYDVSNQNQQQKIQTENSIQQNYFNRTFQQGKIFTSNHQKDQIDLNGDSIFSTKQKIPQKFNFNQNQVSYEKILPFIHIQETKQFVKTKSNKKKQSRRKKNKKILESKLKNIFDDYNEEQQDNEDDESFNNINQKEIPDNKIRNFHSFGH